MYYVDMSSYSYGLRMEIPEAKNVGWLEFGFDFERGRTSDLFVENLKKMILSCDGANVLFNKYRRGHRCAVCRDDNVAVDGALLGRTELIIPSKNKEYFIAPDLVYHYVVEHNYKPPAEFIDSVERFEFGNKFDGYKIYLELCEKNRIRS